MKQAFVLISLTLLVCSLAAAQTGSINNTLGTGGTFTIKDGLTTFFSLSQSNGNLNLSTTLTLPVTTDSTVGVIFKGTERFIHDFRPAGSFGKNVFIGVNSGNFTMTGSGVQACLHCDRCIARGAR